MARIRMKKVMKEAIKRAHLVEIQMDQETGRQKGLIIVTRAQQNDHQSVKARGILDWICLLKYQLITLSSLFN